MSETYFVKHHKKTKFTVLDNTCVQDKELSWKSKGVHTYLMSLPDDWKIYITELVNHSTDGKAALYSAIQELEKHGYVRKIRNRRENGRFDSTVYYVFEKPNLINDDSPLTDFPDVENPDMEKPDLENQQLLNTNNTNYLNIQNTELTNYESQTVSELVFENYIKELFGGEYPFDKNFESDVMKKLESFQLSEQNLESYLKYVFERTRLANPSKSFEGLFRKLALSNSISRDFKLSNHCKQEEKAAAALPKSKQIECSICHTVFNEIDYYCPSCQLSIDAIKDNDNLEITIKRKLYEMTNEERIKYETALQTLVKQKGRGFLTAKEQLQFYKDYGILN